MQPAESMGTESDVQNAQEKILSIIASAGQACPLERVVFELVGVNPKNREVAVNGLLSSGRIEMVQGNTLGSISLRFRSGRQISGATAEEQLVFSLIEESGGKGMWIKDLREKTGLSPQALRKVLSSLERKKLVKSVKPVNSTKKCYILYSSDPDESLTGGVFYSDQQLDSAFVESLVHICVGFIKKKRAKAMEDRPSSSLLCYDESFVHPLELEEFIREKKVCRVSLNVANIERILSVAALDGLIERRSDGLYCIADSKDKQCAAACIPCMHCPVASDCKPGVAISPENCVHLTRWLEDF